MRQWQKREVNVKVGRLAAIVALCAANSAAGPACADDFYSKKTITLLVGASPGGGYDLYARALVRHFSRYIPGEPSFIVQNMPGASSVNLANHLYARAPRDGT